jgi:hypothetical protein
MRYAAFSAVCLLASLSPSFAQLPNIGGDVGNFFEQRKKDLNNGKEEADKQFDKLKDGAVGAVDEALRSADDAAKRRLEETKKLLEDASREGKQALNNLYENGRKGVEDYYRNLAKSANDLVEAGQSASRFMEREVSGYGETLSNAEKRVRQGKIIDAVWHLYTEPLQNTSEHAADAATENELLGQAMAVAATAYGGPAGAAAYAAWLTYQKTGNADMALRVGVLAAAQSYVTAQAGAMPQGTAGELAKKALVTGAAGGIAVAAAGGDETAVREAFVKQGGMVMMQGGKAYITKKFDGAAGQIDSFCASSVGTSCKPLLDAVKRDKDGNILFDKDSRPVIDTTKLLPGKANLGTWTDNPNIPKVSKGLPGIPSLTILKGEWAISYDKELLKSKNVNAPAVAITYVGPASHYARKVEELNIAVGARAPYRQSATPIELAPKPEMWVALGNVGTPETFFQRMFYRSREVLSVGDIVRATRDVNARPGPARWDRTYVLPKNSVIVIGEIRELPAGGTTQRWARLDLDAAD